MGQVYDLLAAAFGEKDAPLVRFEAQTEQDSTFRLRHGRVAVRNGRRSNRVVGYVRIFARTMMVRGRPVPVGGIGSVATERGFQSQGIATALLQDAIAQMRREGMQASFLFTGIPGFYERLGYRTVREPQFELDAAACATIAHAGLWDVRPMRESDDRPALATYRRAIAGSTGAVARTLRTWRDARSWLAEDPGGCFVAERTGTLVAYIRSRRRAYGRQILEAECAPGHEGAIPALAAEVGRRAIDHRERIVTLTPSSHPLATALRSAGAAETAAAAHPMMVLSLDGPGVEAALHSDEIRFWNSDRI